MRNNSSLCVASTTRMLANILKEPYLDMVFVSSLGLGEIGSLKTCEGDLADYGA